MMGQAQAVEGMRAGSLRDGGRVLCKGQDGSSRDVKQEHHRGKDPEVRVNRAI